MIKAVATVAVDNTFFSFDTDYTYLIPNEFAEKIKLGDWVSVPFGKGNKLRDGIVVNLYEKDVANDELKSIYEIKKNVLSVEAVKLALWLKERCFCTTYDCLKQMLPRGFNKIGSKVQRMIRLNDDVESPKLTPKQRIVFDLLSDVGAAGANEICEFCSVGIGVLKTMEKHGIITFYEKEVYFASVSFSGKIKL